jgi:hypothetical protein
MTRPAARTVSSRTGSSRKVGSDLDAWLLGEPDLDEAAVALLAAYRDATETTRKAIAPTEAPKPVGEEAGGEAPAEPGPAAPKVQPAVPRLVSLAGVEDERLPGLHGRMLAAGYLTAEVVGKGDGLVYRVTREGLRRLNGEAIEAEAA